MARFSWRPPPQEVGGSGWTIFGVMGRSVTLGFKWGELLNRLLNGVLVYMWGAYRKAIKWGDSITFYEEIGN